jgi:hypothetical protein
MRLLIYAVRNSPVDLACGIQQLECHGADSARPKTFRQGKKLKKLGETL